MRRRDFIKVTCGAAVTWPLSARAQQPAKPVVGFLGVTPAPLRAQLAALHRALAEAGYVDGREHQDRVSLVGRATTSACTSSRRVSPHCRYDVLLATSGDAGALAAKGATVAIPVVFIAGVRPDQARPCRKPRPSGRQCHGGVHLFSTQLEEKRIELLRQAVPSAVTLGILVNPQYPVRQP